MTKQRQHAVFAGTLYLLFALLTAGVFVQWYRDDPKDAIASLQKLSGGGGAILLIVALIAGVALLVRPAVGIAVVVLSAVAGLIGFLGMYVVGPFWLLPVPYVWLAYRGRHDT